MILTLSVSIWPSVYAVLLSESEFLKSSLGTPKATDSDVVFEMFHLHEKCNFSNEFLFALVLVFF